MLRTPRPCPSQISRLQSKEARMKAIRAKAQPKPAEKPAKKPAAKKNAAKAKK